MSTMQQTEQSAAGSDRVDRKRASGSGRTLAERADRYELYQTSVQEPECDVEFFERIYRESYHRLPVVLREDFCGTAALCCEWIKHGPTRRAIGVDLDTEPLAWCRANNFPRLNRADRERVELIEADARLPHGEKADVISAQNFSFFFLKSRTALLEYLRAAHANLNERGILVFDMVGGSEVLEEELEEVTEHDGFDYVWEQHRFDPVTAEQTCFIHFRFPDDSVMERAFEYRWRLWTMPEVRELMLEAGFRRADVYWEGTEEDSDEGNGEFSRVEHARSEPAWVSYLVGVK